MYVVPVWRVLGLFVGVRWLGCCCCDRVQPRNHGSLPYSRCSNSKNPSTHAGTSATNPHWPVLDSSSENQAHWLTYPSSGLHP